MMLSHLPDSADVTWQVCPNIEVTDFITSVKTWRKSPKASLVYILVIGAGGDGAAGTQDGATGGGGGGSGGQTMVLLPALLAPDVLYVSEFANTSMGSRLMGVFVHPEADTLARWRAACVAYANFGSVANAASGGAAGAIATVNNMPLGHVGIVNKLAGQAGAAGGVNAVGASIAYGTTGLLSTAGAGGGGGENDGGEITKSDPRPGIVGGSASYGSPGLSGINVVNGALLPCGGTGGRGLSSTKRDGHMGGPGGYGGGGGGGGSCSPGYFAGQGGAGGPGLIVIAQW